MSPVSSPLAAPPMPNTESSGATDETAVAPADGNAEAKPKATNKPRDYDIHVRVKGTADKLKAKIDELVADGRGEILVVLGKSEALQPKIALQGFGQDHDLSGEYEVAAVKAFTKLNATSETETKRKVKIG